MVATTYDDVLQAALRLTPEEQARLRDELGHHEAAAPTTPASRANFVTALQTAEPAEIFIQPNDQMPSVTEAGRCVREAILPLDWRLQHIVVEFTDDVQAAAAVLTREQLDLEPA